MRQCRGTLAEMVRQFRNSHAAKENDESTEQRLKERELRIRLKKLQEQLDYIENYPLNKPYIALFATAKDTAKDTAGRSK